MSRDPDYLPSYNFVQYLPDRQMIVHQHTFPVNLSLGERMMYQQISFGDNVRVRSSIETQAMDIVGLVGQVYGETTPSITGIEVIGDVKDDYAINVYFEERDESIWFAPDLLEFVDHSVGTEFTLKGVGVDKKWTRTASGDWVESSTTKESRSFWERITSRVFKKKG